MPPMLRNSSNIELIGHAVGTCPKFLWTFSWRPRLGSTTCLQKFSLQCIFVALSPWSWPLRPWPIIMAQGISGDGKGNSGSRVWSPSRSLGTKRSSCWVRRVLTIWFWSVTRHLRATGESFLPKLGPLHICDYSLTYCKFRKGFEPQIHHWSNNTPN